MATVEIYTTSLCPYCSRAKRLLKSKNVAFVEHDIWRDQSRHDDMLTRAEGRHTVPQIFINGEGIGGCDELFALEAQSRLDPLLAAAAHDADEDHATTNAPAD